MTTFTTFDDAVIFCELALGEFVNDYDIDWLATKLWCAQLDGIDLSEDDIWTLAEKADIRFN